MIEPTDEMGEVFERARRDYWKAIDHDTGEGGLTVAEHERAARRQAVAALLAAVERDHRVVARCADDDCERMARHGGMHGCFDGHEWVTWW